MSHSIVRNAPNYCLSFFDNAVAVTEPIRHCMGKLNKSLSNFEKIMLIWVRDAKSGSERLEN